MADDEYEAGTPLPDESAVVETEEAPAPVVELKQPKAREPDFDPTAKPVAKPDLDEERALRMGWSPKDQWKGAEDKWVDAKTFVERANPAILLERMDKMAKDFETNTQRLERMNQAALERQKQEMQAQLDGLKAERDRLIDQHAGDADTIKQINANYEERREEIKNPPQQGRPPEAEAWVQKRPQYNTDPVFKAAAFDLMGQIHKEWDGKPLAAQMEELDRRLAASGRFQDIYGSPAAKPQAASAPPADMRQMDGVRISAKKGTNYYSRLPEAAKTQFQRFVKSGAFKADEAEAYAKEYVEGNKE